MSRKFRPAQCPKCYLLSQTKNIKYPRLVDRVCEAPLGMSTSPAGFEGESSGPCPDFEPKIEEVK